MMDESKYLLQQEGSTQGQVIGDHNTVIINPPEAQTPPLLASQPVWNIPYFHNPYFTGREEILHHLHHALLVSTTTALTQRQAINGLGGIGKTQIAVEYAYRHREAYHAILWVNAATRESIIASFLELATLLDLPQHQETDQSIVVAAVKRWFTTQSQWLLIFDNADDLALAREFLPTSETGHLLLTTRNQTLGTLATSIAIEPLDRQQGMLLLLRRATLLPRDAPLEQATPADRVHAEFLVKEMDGLPLALDQAAAYIEETQSDLATYRQKYQQRRDTLLQRRGETIDHPLPVTATWSLSFTQVQQTNPLAADLLCVCAFLAPEEIAETMLLEGAAELGPLLATLPDQQANLDEAIGVLRRYSLVKRNREAHTLSIHRLVQAVLQLDMDEPTRTTWAERIIRALNHAFPSVEYTTWPHCERLVSHALHSAELIAQYHLALPEAARLLHQTAVYLQARAQYSQAEPLYQQALSISKKAEGPEHPSTATTMHALASLYQAQGRYGEAEPLYQQALAIYQQALGPEHPNTQIARNSFTLLQQKMHQEKEW